jgi:hypothetical protein
MKYITRLIIGYLLIILALGAIYVFGQSFRLTCFESEGEAVCYTQKRLYGLIPISEKKGISGEDLLKICDPFHCHLEYQGLIKYVYDVREGNRVVNFLAAPQEDPMQVYFINMPLSFSGFVFITMPGLILGVVLIASAFNAPESESQTQVMGEPELDSSSDEEDEDTQQDESPFLEP